MSVKPDFEFLKNEAGEEEGLGDAGIETFKDTPYASCAREAGQNSSDAKVTQPVLMTFDVIRVPSDDVPGIETLRRAIDACLAKADQEKEIDFFTNAASVIAKTDIAVLRIQDFNTKGLTGPPNEPGSPFRSLLKGSGVSKKDSETSGGSFGIGKNATFAVSDLQVVFYSTLYEGLDGTLCFAAQGKTKLISHCGSDQIERRSVGYWGNPQGFGAVTNANLVPDWMRRDEIGTSIFSVGFRQSEDWAKRMTYSLVSNFFCAIHREEMIFEVASGGIKINKNTLDGYLIDHTVQEAAESAGHKSDLEFAAQLYKCLTSDASVTSEIEIEGLGKFVLRTLVGDSLCKRIGIVRNGMLISNSLEHFGDKLARFPGARDFVAMVEPGNEQASKILKTLENPAHNGFSAERVSDPVKRQTAERAMKKLARELRSQIREFTEIEPDNSVVLDELSNVFANRGDDDSPVEPSSETDPEKLTYKPPRRKSSRSDLPSNSEGMDGGQGGRDPNSSDGGCTNGKFEGDGTGGSGKRGKIQGVELLNVRNRLIDQTGGREVHFQTQISGTIGLSCVATGINSPERLTICSSSIGEVKEGIIILDVCAGDRVSIAVRFNDDYSGPIELIALDKSSGSGA